MAAQLTSTYAQYDNGKVVFPFYDNFKGTTINTNTWKEIGAGSNGNSLVVDNGLSMTSAYSCGGAIGIVTNHVFTTPYIIEASGSGIVYAGGPTLVGPSVSLTQSFSRELYGGSARLTDSYSINWWKPFSLVNDHGNGNSYGLANDAVPYASGNGMEASVNGIVGLEWKSTVTRAITAYPTDYGSNRQYSFAR